MDSSKVLARAIARLRAERALTQEELSEKARISQKFLSALELGKRTPSIATIDALCAAFGMTPSALFAAGEPPRSKRRSIAAQIDSLVGNLSTVEQDHVLSIVREAVGLAVAARRSAE